ncbi:MAG: rubrerythrin [Proteobacteria bacterium]|jgi:rubrerythrin|nr:rubrerythrin [Pseudomonadota bacterium]
MKSLSLASALVLVFAIGCGGGQPTPPAPAPEPTPEVEATPDAGPAAEATPPPPPAEPSAPALKTPENLEAAYAGETDAIARYKAFAAAADKEKYKDVAALFRAAARAEEIHAQKLADLIAAAGGTPAAGTATPEVKKTALNIKAAIAGESADSDTLYKGFAETAKAEGRTDAESAFKVMMEVEAGNTKLFKRAEKDLAYWKQDEREFWVCPVCGFVMTSRKESCGVCATDPSTFEEIE